MKRRFTGFVLALSLVAATVTGFVAVSANTYGDWEYEDNGATVTITGYTGTEESVTIPDTIEGKPVTAIGEWAFVNCDSLTSITIPNSVTSIEDFAFRQCFSLTSITIPNSVTSIGHGVFWACASLTSIAIPNSVTSMGGDVFRFCENLYDFYFDSAIPPTFEISGFFNVRSGARAIVPQGATAYGPEGSLWNGLVVTYSQGSPPADNVSINNTTFTYLGKTPEELEALVGEYVTLEWVDGVIVYQFGDYWFIFDGYIDNSGSGNWTESQPVGKTQYIYCDIKATVDGISEYIDVSELDRLFGPKEVYIADEDDLVLSDIRGGLIYEYRNVRVFIECDPGNMRVHKNASVTLSLIDSDTSAPEPEPSPTPEPSPEPETPEYIYTPPAFGGGFTIPPGAVKDITDAATAKSAIFDIIASLTPEQRQSGDALDDTALFIESAVRAGASRNVPGDVSLGAAILSALADIARDISASAHSALERENIGLLRFLRTNVTIRTDGTGSVKIIFPDDVSDVEFDNVTVEADFASVTFNRNDIQSGGELTLGRVSSESRAPVDDEIAAVPTEDDNNTLNPLDFWSVGVIVLILIAWCVLALCKHRLRAWVVPTFCILALALNAYTYFPVGDSVADDAGEAVNTTPALSDDYVPDTADGIEITMSAGVRVTLSLPAEGGAKDFLALFNEKGEIQYSKYNPITDTLDARIRESGIYTLKEYVVSFTDIDKKSDLMKDAILQLASKNIMTGTTDGFFFPDKPITRAELVSAVVRAFDLMDMDASSSFADIDRSDWFYSAAATAEKERIISGFEDNTFRGDLDIPKDQLVTVSANTLIEFMGYMIPADIEAELTRYLDREDIAPWSEGSIALATQSDIMIYRTDSLFAPQSIMTRGDAAIVLYRMFSKVW